MATPTIALLVFLAGLIGAAACILVVQGRNQRAMSRTRIAGIQEDLHKISDAQKNLITSLSQFQEAMAGYAEASDQGASRSA